MRSTLFSTVQKTSSLANIVKNVNNTRKNVQKFVNQGKSHIKRKKNNLTAVAEKENGGIRTRVNTCWHVKFAPEGARE